VPQITLDKYIEQLDKAGLLVRYTDEKRVDELPCIMEDNPDQAILVEHVRDCAFPFFANGYGSRAMYALSLDCEEKQVTQETARRTGLSYPAQVVPTGPCKDVIIRGDDVDLTMFPLFQHHPRDGQAYLNDTRVVSRNPDTGLINDSIQRFMYRAPNLTNVDMRARQHGGSINAARHHELGTDMPIAVCIGGPTLDVISSMMRLPGADKWDMLGGFLGEPAQVVKCETNDLTVPVNAEIVLEGRVLTSEGEIHDEGPYGEFSGTYGGGVSRNWNVVIDCITHRKDCIYQYATISGLHPGRTDMAVWQLAIEAELFTALQRASILVQDVFCPHGACNNIGYVSVKTRNGGDGMQALAIMLGGGRQQMPKLAYVFDEDIDIHDDERVKWAQAWRYNPGTDTAILPGQNMLPLDPSIGSDEPPVHIAKIGFDCTIPVVGHVDRLAYDAAVVSEPIAQPQDPGVLTEDQVTDEMEQLIRAKPSNWPEILEHFAGQPYQLLYRAFGRLRPKLGRIVDDAPRYPYTFSDVDIVYSQKK
jgi:4-hydroxy-3-polyprenylbenzoate decarboxylase